ncbi:thioesterase family protein [Aurantimonas sp. VKM B-3413]|uniref:acyl-CoA thioesterase n=1 Tax=Aurantimonas sp. VKM B-3413 TaxID=2779401 RepID=UPI001E40AA33|nr:acyl-CoA thioesterase [Aurantimonas sp. VKM B-3413]MCB8840298.1 acyl-CoA thioesterase [Aurantimonas sp. VKM B-3413]
MPGEVFEARYKLRFGQCDPAGIAFFPRLVEMVNWTVEDWFDTALGDSFRHIHMEEKRGVPAVSVAVDFLGPARLGDMVVFRLAVTAIGRSSIMLDIRAEREDGQKVLSARHTIVHCDLSNEAPKSLPLPDDLRQAVERFRVEDAAVDG